MSISAQDSPLSAEANRHGTPTGGTGSTITGAVVGSGIDGNKCPPGGAFKSSLMSDLSIVGAGVVVAGTALAGTALLPVEVVIGIAAAAAMCLMPIGLGQPGAGYKRAAGDTLEETTQLKDEPRGEPRAQHGLRTQPRTTPRTSPSGFEK